MLANVCATCRNVFPADVRSCHTCGTLAPEARTSTSRPLLQLSTGTGLAETMPPTPTVRGLSRRTLLRAGGVGALVLVGSNLSSCGLFSSQAEPATPTPTPLPVGTLVMTYRGHSDSVYTVVWSPTSQRIASGS